MKIFKYLVLISIAITIAVSSCNKDSGSKSKKDILTSHQWKIYSYKENGVAVALDNCEKDDFVKFEINGTYTFNPTTVKCNVSDVIENGIWSLSGDEKSIIIDGTSSSLLELTDSRLVVKTIDGIDSVEWTYVAF